MLWDACHDKQLLEYVENNVIMPCFIMGLMEARLLLLRQLTKHIDIKELIHHGLFLYCKALPVGAEGTLAPPIDLKEYINERKDHC